MCRHKTRKVQVGSLAIGGDAPVTIQSMTNVPASDPEGTTAQILALEKAGCEIVRMAVPTEEDAAIFSYAKAHGCRIIYDGKPIYDSEKKIAEKMLPYRRKMQIIFQDPSASLDPRMTVGEIVGEALDIHKLYTGKGERTARINQLLEEVGLNTEHSNRFPHEFSGGQQQRIGIARALAVEPEFIVCDEPISALDVSIQSQVVNMLEDLQDELGLTYLFIAHDISVVRHISNRIGVMYLGNLVELAESYELYKNPIHPYTKTLMSAVPIPDPVVTRSRERMILEGDIPSPINPPSGCKFHTRCPYATERCSQEVPVFKDYGGGHFAACHLLDK